MGLEMSQLRPKSEIVRLLSITRAAPVQARDPTGLLSPVSNGSVRSHENPESS